MTWEPFEMKPGIEAALHRLASAVKRDGAESCHALVKGGEVRHVQVQDETGAHYLNLIGGEWFELVGVDG